MDYIHEENETDRMEDELAPTDWDKVREFMARPHDDDATGNGCAFGTGAARVVVLSAVCGFVVGAVIVVLILHG